MQILYNQDIQVMPDPQSRSKKVIHIIANTIQFSKDTPVYVVEKNLTLKNCDLLLQIYIKISFRKRLNEIMETEQKSIVIMLVLL